MRENTEKAVLFFDIDGTIISEKNGKIPQSTIEALEQAKKNGHYLFINTGRTICFLPKEIRQLPFDGFLCGCGTYLTYKEEVLFSHPLEQERGNAIIQEMMACNLGGVAEGEKDLYFPEKTTRFEKLERTRAHLHEMGMGKEYALESGAFIYDKLFIHTDEQGDMKRFQIFIEKDMEALRRGPSVYEVVQRGFSKATACEKILEILQIPKERAYVFGDSSNDLAMFQFADHAVAMGKHDPILDPYTEFVTKTVEDGGIAYAMEHYGL